MQRMLRSSLSSFFYQGARWLGWGKGGTRILCYHRVNDEEKDYLVVPVANFREQMKYLSEEGYQTIGLGDFLKNGKSEGRKVVITFDDGYRDNYKQAFPILKELGFQATIFCVGKWIGGLPHLLLNDIQQMRRAGFEFGSHTLSHAHLASLNRDEKWHEISGSKKFLEDLLGVATDFFCYPYGEYDEEAVELVAKAGYRGACSNIPGTNKEINPYLLKRTEIGAADTLEDFKKKLAGSYDLIHQGLHWLRGRA